MSFCPRHHISAEVYDSFLRAQLRTSIGTMQDEKVWQFIWRSLLHWLPLLSNVPIVVRNCNSTHFKSCLGSSSQDPFSHWHDN